MGIGRKEVVPGQAERKETVGVQEIEVKNRGEEGVIVQQHRKAIDSKKVLRIKEVGNLQERNAEGVDWEKYVTFPEEKERRVTQFQPKSENTSLPEEEYNNVLERPKACSEGKDLITSNCLEVNRPDSKSRNTYVKLWENKESQRNDQTPKRIKVQIGSLSCGDTVRFLEAEKARVLGEIREEKEKRLGCGRDAKALMGTRDKAWKQVEDSNGMAMYIVPESKEGEALEPRTEEQKRAEDRAAEIKEIRRTDRDESGSQELRSLRIPGGKVKQKPETELRAIDEIKARLEVKAGTRGAGQEEKLAGGLRGRQVTPAREQMDAGGLRGRQVTPAREQIDARGQKGTSLHPPFETVKKIERRPIENSTLLSIPPKSRDSKSHKSYQGDRWAVGGAEVEKGRAAKQGAAEDEEKELQKKALFHLEALRRIEESYNKRGSREKNDNFRTKRPNETTSHHPGHNWDNTYPAGVHETRKDQCRSLQKKGKGGLNALLAPIFEEELQRQFQDFDDNSPTNSDTDKKVAIFRGIKKARLRAAEAQIAAAKARGNQIRAQLKATPEKVENIQKVQALARGADRKDKKIGGESFKSQKDNVTTKQTEGRLVTYTPSVKRNNELNEKARAEAEMERERRRRAKMKEDEMRARLRRGGPDYASVELYGRLNRDERKAKFGPTLGFKSSPDTSQKLNGNSRFKYLELSRKRVNRRFKSPPASPRKTMQTNALEHFANWEKELRSAQRSKSRSKERSKERRVTIMEAPIQNTLRRESPELKIVLGEKAFISNKSSNKSSPRYQNLVIMPSSEPIPDHYGSVAEDCTCEVKHKKERRERNRVKVLDERTRESPKGSHRKENCRSLNWLGKLYNTMTSFS